MHLLYKAFCLDTPEKFLPPMKLITSPVLCCQQWEQKVGSKGNLLQIASLLTTMTKLGHVAWWRDRIFTIRIITAIWASWLSYNYQWCKGSARKTQAYNWGPIWGIYLKINFWICHTYEHVMLCLESASPTSPKSLLSEFPYLLDVYLVAF